MNGPNDIGPEQPVSGPSKSSTMGMTNVKTRTHTHIEKELATTNGCNTKTKRQKTNHRLVESDPSEISLLRSLFRDKLSGISKQRINVKVTVNITSHSMSLSTLYVPPHSLPGTNFRDITLNHCLQNHLRFILRFHSGFSQYCPFK